MAKAIAWKQGGVAGDSWQASAACWVSLWWLRERYPPARSGQWLCAACVCLCRWLHTQMLNMLNTCLQVRLLKGTLTLVYLWVLLSRGELAWANSQRHTVQQPRTHAHAHTHTLDWSQCLPSACVCMFAYCTSQCAILMCEHEWMGVEMSLLKFEKYRDQAVTRCQGQHFSQGKLHSSSRSKCNLAWNPPTALKANFFFHLPSFFWHYFESNAKDKRPQSIHLSTHYTNTHIRKHNYSP